MSASLVGSEMCIRDSLGDEAELDSAQVRAAAAVRRQETQPARSVSPGRVCLLYTSDAADDM
eukprot:12958272-Alexandrium_andersonii.AAC.1